ncbi:MAG: T9SS type A sorting domain-containing protein [bacterium]
MKHLLLILSFFLCFSFFTNAQQLSQISSPYFHPIFTQNNYLFNEPIDILSNNFFYPTNDDLYSPINFLQKKLAAAVIYKPSLAVLNFGDIQVSFSYNTQGNLFVQTEEHFENGTLKEGYRHTYTYNSAGNKTTYIMDSYTNGAWINSFQITYSYDIYGHLLSELLDYEVNGIWHNQDLYTYTYDLFGNNLSKIQQKWINDTWENLNRNTYTYNSLGKALTQLFEVWNNNTWVNSSLSTYTYDGLGNNLTQMREVWYGYWARVTLITFTYNNLGNPLTSLTQTMGASDWQNYILLTYTYSSQQNTLLTQRWSVDWENVELLTTSFDTNGNLLSEVTNVWYMENWTEYLRTLYTTYDVNGNCTEAKCDRWLDNNWQPNDGVLNMHYNNNSSSLIFLAKTILLQYTSFSDVNDDIRNPISFSLYQNYPNPFNPTTTIKYTIPASNVVSLKVYDVLGTEVANLADGYKNAGSYEVNFNASNLSSGTYFYQLKAGNYMETKKLLLLK